MSRYHLTSVVVNFNINNNISNNGNGTSGWINPDWESVQNQTTVAVKTLENEGARIIAVVPLISSFVSGTALINTTTGPVHHDYNNSYNYSRLKTYGGGYGFGGAITEGIIIFAEVLKDDD